MKENDLNKVNREGRLDVANQPTSERSYWHLKKPEYAIIACVNDSKNEKKIKQKFEQDPRALHLEYGGDEKKLQKEGVIFEKEDWYISPIDDRKKYSRSYHACTGIAIVGKEKKTGKNISLMTHEAGYDKDFWRILKTKLIDFRNRAEAGTIDAILFGGSVDAIENEDNLVVLNDSYESYKKEMKDLSKNVSELMGFDPTIITKENNAGLLMLSQSFYLDTQKRNFYIFKPLADTVNKNTHIPHQMKG